MDTTQSSSGASNAGDFQPPTGNPQQVGTSNQSTPQTIQPSTTVGSNQDELYRNLPSDLSVQTQGTPVLTRSTTTLPDQPTTNSTFPWVGITGAIIVFVVAVIVYRRWNIFSAQTAPVAIVAEELPAVTVQSKKKSSKPKSAAKNKLKVKKPKKRRQ